MALKNQKKDLLTINEIDTFFSNNNHFSWIDITGGEIFLHKEIDTVFEIPWEESPELKMVMVFDEVHRLLEKYGGQEQPAFWPKVVMI